MSNPKPGDRVRVVIEGPVHERHGITTIGDSNITHVTSVGLQNAVSVEVLEKPKPEWWPAKPGDVILVGATEYVITASGVFYGHGGGQVPSTNNTPVKFAEWLTEWATRNSWGWERVALLHRAGQGRVKRL